MLLPHETALVEPFLDRIDALVVTGGAFDIDPALFGATSRHATVTLKADRTAFELGVTRGALARDMPVLGICRGQQPLHVALGGTPLHPSPDEVPGAPAPAPPHPRTAPGP